MPTALLQRRVGVSPDMCISALKAATLKIGLLRLAST